MHVVREDKLFLQTKQKMSSDFGPEIMLKSCQTLAHLSLLQVVKDVLRILWTHVTVLRVLRVDVKLLRNLDK